MQQQRTYFSIAVAAILSCSFASICPNVYASETDPNPELRLIKTDRQSLSALPPSPNPGFDVLASRFLISLTVDLGNMQRTSKSGVYKYVTAQKQITKEQYHYNLALHREMTHVNPNMDILLTAIGKDGINIAGKHISESLTVLEKIQSGIAMDINFTKMAAPKEEPKKPDLVRYGLAAKKLDDSSRIESSIATSNTPEMDLFHNRDRVENDYDWTIEEIYDDATAMDLESDSRVAQRVSRTRGGSGSESGSASTSASASTSTLDGQSAATPTTSGMTSYLPSPNFSTKVAPVYNGSKGLLTAQLTQAEGFYSFSINRPLVGGGELSKRHVFTAPIYRTIKIQRTYNEKGLERTSLLELKAHSLDHYAINMHYWHQKSYYSCDVGYSLRAHKVTFESKMNDIFKASGYAGSSAKAQYKVAYNFGF